MAPDIVAFNVGSSSVEAKTWFGETVGRTGVAIEALPRAAFEIAEELGVDESTEHVHRVVHGGDMSSPQDLDEDTVDSIEYYSRFASVHNPAELKVIRALQDRTNRPGKAVFDTSFHQSIPSHRRAYGIPDELYEAGVKQYGFHGISVRGATRPYSGGTVCLHLGSGCSVTAVYGGESKATSMGLTPFDGCLMRTRPGRLDPGVVLELCRHFDSADDVDTYLNESCGWEGMSDESLKDLVADDPQGFVPDVFVSSVVDELHRVAGAIPSVDQLVFTGGVGENNAVLRERICEEANLISVSLGDAANQDNDSVISSKSSPVQVIVHEAHEAETMIDMVHGV